MFYSSKNSLNKHDKGRKFYEQKENLKNCKNHLSIKNFATRPPILISNRILTGGGGCCYGK